MPPSIGIECIGAGSNRFCELPLLEQASVSQIRREEPGRRDGYIAVVMCHYPRGLRTEARDAFISELAPDRPLLAEWKECEREKGHEAAFKQTHYEERFQLSAWALHLLEELSRRSLKEDVYLVCQCEVGERCHREMLMLLAKAKFKASVGKIFKKYPVWIRRIKGLKLPLPESALASGKRNYPDSQL